MKEFMYLSENEKFDDGYNSKRILYLGSISSEKTMRINKKTYITKDQIMI